MTTVTMHPKTAEAIARRRSGTDQPQHVIVTDIRLPFMTAVRLCIYFTCAATIAAAFLAIVGAAIAGSLGALFASLIP